MTTNGTDVWRYMSMNKSFMSYLRALLSHLTALRRLLSMENLLQKSPEKTQAWYRQLEKIATDLLEEHENPLTAKLDIEKHFVKLRKHLRNEK
jgi:vacuolar-type H+-ATPase subunit I/STV1